MSWGPLVVVLVGVAVLATGMLTTYAVMRTVGLEHGGACSTGGPYEINPGQECQDGLFGLAFGGILASACGVLALLWGSHRHGGPLVVTSASGVSWSAFFGGLGGSFLSIGAEMPARYAAASEFTGVGMAFLVMAALGLLVVVGPVVYAPRGPWTDIPTPSTRTWLLWFAAVAGGTVVGTVVGTLIAAAAR